MLKPNYHWKEKGKNYKIWVYHGNNYFGFKRTRGIYDVLINGYVVRFISQYPMPQLPFPPSLDDLRKAIRRKPANINEARILAFDGADMVFFECNRLKTKSFKFFYEHYIDIETYTLGVKDSLVYCIDSEIFENLTKEMRCKMPYILDDRKLNHHVHHNDISDLKFVKFLDAKFHELKDILPAKLRESLEL